MVFRPEPRWPASLALIACSALYVVLPNRLVVGPRWLLPILVILPLIPLSLRAHRRPDDASWVRHLCVALIGLISAVNSISVVMLLNRVFSSAQVDGRGLLYSAASIWMTNVIVFGLWFWELDRGGPHIRAGADVGPPDLQFPQMTVPEHAKAEWHPRFFDYLYTSFANGTSFAPADAMPLTTSMKSLFAIESLISFVTIAVVAGEAVNILR